MCTINLKCGTPQQQFTDGPDQQGEVGEKEKEKDKDKGKDKFWMKFFKKAQRTGSGADPSTVAGIVNNIPKHIISLTHTFRNYHYR